ncbi:hypothetical protein D9C73_012010 [Collichthys lucidus]|uniref:Uncharacterized protein n=1 Tax=Collichthys lucidus TaxID=240159 RepID=A0A4U5UWR1_COLLU|nr:hypothetical protein D9C73_012010 [Collichthys lucidus]
MCPTSKLTVRESRNNIMLMLTCPHEDGHLEADVERLCPLPPVSTGTVKHQTWLSNWFRLELSVEPTAAQLEFCSSSLTF